MGDEHPGPAVPEENYLDIRQQLVQQLSGLEEKLKAEAVIGRWSFERSLDRIAKALAPYLESRMDIHHTERPCIGCSLIYRTLPEHCYVGGASKDRREMDFDARYYSLKSDWPQSVTAFSMTHNVALVLDRCESDWWELTKVGLGHEKKSCELPAENTASFFCFPVSHKDSGLPAPEAVRSWEMFRGSRAYDRMKPLLDECLRYRDLLDQESRLESLLKGDPHAQDDEIADLIARNRDLHEGFHRSYDGAGSSLSTLDEAILGLESTEKIRRLKSHHAEVYYALKPSNRIQLLESPDSGLNQSAYQNLWDLAKAEPELERILNEEEKLNASVHAPDEANAGAFLRFKKFDLKHKKRALKIIHSRILEQPRRSYCVAAIRITSKFEGYARTVEGILEREPFYEDKTLKEILCTILRDGVDRVGGSDMAEVALGTLSDIFYAVPIFGLGEYYALDRTTSFLQALFGSCEVSVFEAHKSARPLGGYSVELRLAATTALGADEQSQHKRFRTFFYTKNNCYLVNLTDDNRAPPYLVRDEVGTGKTGKAYVLNLRGGGEDEAEKDTELKVLTRKEDTVSHLFEDCGEIPNGDTRSFLAFAIASRYESELPYGVIRIVSGKEEEFKSRQIRLAKVVGRGLSVLWKFFPKNEELAIYGADDKDLNQFLDQHVIHTFLQDHGFYMERFRREFKWLLQKLFHEEHEIILGLVERTGDGLSFEVDGPTEYSFECFLKDRDKRYVMEKRRGVRETRNLKGRILDIDGGTEPAPDNPVEPLD